MMSDIIHSFALPREPRVELAATPTSHSAEEAIDADNLCQKSEVAMRDTLPHRIK
jgi:hypothetical protein